MNENTESRLLIGVIFLLIYQTILGVGSLWPLPVGLERGLWTFPVMGGCGLALILVSVGMARRSPRAFLVGMICHLLLAIPAFVAVLVFGYGGVSGLLSEEGAGSAWAPLILLLALMCLPFALISGWAYFYLRRLRNRLLSQ